MKTITKKQTSIAEYEKTRFFDEYWKVFFEMAENPPEPTERMKRASTTYKKILSEEEEQKALTELQTLLSKRIAAAESGAITTKTFAQITTDIL